MTSKEKSPDAFERAFIRAAYKKLENPSLLMKTANLAGRPLSAGLNRLPNKALRVVASATERALQTGLTGALKTLPRPTEVGDLKTADKRSRSSGRFHTVFATGTGIAAGFFGGLAFPLELATTTTIILRAIASIAAEHGFDPNDPETRAECLYILALGTKHEGDLAGDEAKTSYLRSRLAFSGLIKNAGAYMAGKTAEEVALALQKKSAPMLVRLLGEVAKRFEVVALEKFMGQIVPVAAAIGGGAINALFADFFTDMARYHFGLRALENKYGEELVQQIYGASSAPQS